MLLLFHVLCILYAFGVISIHRYIIAQNLQVIVDYLGHNAFGYFQPVIVTKYILIACHGIEVLRTIVISLHARELRFTKKSSSHAATHPHSQPHGNSSAYSNGPSIRDAEEHTVARGPSPTGVVGAVPVKTRFPWLRTLREAICVRLQLYSIAGARYDSLYFVFEVAELSLSTFQAYKLSALVSAVWINRLYALVLVCNCWSTVFVHRFLHRNQLVKRVLLLAVDAFLDMIANMAIPSAIFLPYYWTFDLSLRDFPMENYYLDVWLIQAISENQQVFVTSWLDFVSKMSPHGFVLCSIWLLKQMLVVDTIKPTKTLVAIDWKAETPKRKSKWTALLPTASTRVRIGYRLLRLSQSATGSLRAGLAGSLRLNSAQRLALKAELFTKRSNVWHDLVFVFSGIAILAIHIHTTFVAGASAHNGCLLAMRAWFMSEPTCASLEVNCAVGPYDDGQATESFRTVFTSVEPESLKALVLSGCPRLHVPPAIHLLSGLQMLKVYNSTVETWDATAELSDDFNPNLTVIYFADANFSTGEIPIGMLSKNTPRPLVDVEFSGTNLERLPSDLGTKWPSIMYFVLERSPGITAFPDVLAKMKIPQLMLGSNRIQSIPVDALADQAFWKLMLDGNPLNELPNTIATVHDLYKVGFAYTNVSTVPAWAINGSSTSNDIPFLGFADLYGGGSPLCASPEATTAQLKSWFPLDCSPDAPTHAYRIEREREWRAASQAAFCAQASS